MKNNILVAFQILLIFLWILASYILDQGFNIFVFNILPIPNIGLVFVTIVLVTIGYGLQKLKDKNQNN